MPEVTPANGRRVGARLDEAMSRLTRTVRAKAERRSTILREPFSPRIHVPEAGGWLTYLLERLGRR